jgi:dienelactone hydrolase
VKVKTFLAAAKPFLIAPLLVLIAATGCATYKPAAVDRAFFYEAPAAFTASPTAWPSRSTDRLHEIVEIAPELFSLRVRYDALVSGQTIKAPKLLPAKEQQHSYLAGRGIIRTYVPPEGSGEQVLSTGMCFFSGVEGVIPAATSKKKSMLVRGKDEDSSTHWLVNLRGTWMRLDSPTGGLNRGLVVHLTSYGGYQYERPVLEELRTRGWAVLWVDSSTVRPETTRIEVDNDDPGVAGRRIAANIDDRVAEIAYAVEAAVEFIERQRPDIPTGPLVVTGYSAGSLATPAVAALLGDRVQAAVLVGSGANLLDISQRSRLTDGGLKLQWTRRPSEDDKKRLMEEYLQASRLDPYWAATTLRSKPVLMMHATLDKIVPADSGDLLYRRLGQPERLNFYLGHELLFFRLPSHASVIANWLEDALANKAVARREAEKFAAKQAAR